MMKVTATGRTLRDEIQRLAGASGNVELDGFPEGQRSQLASAMGAVSALMPIASDVDREFMVEAVRSPDQVVVAIRRGPKVAAPDHGNPSEFEAKR